MATLADLKAEAKKYGMTVRKKDGEFRVSWPYDELSAYYTNDIDDALGTMRIMHRDKDDKHVLMSLQTDGSIIGYLSSSASGRPKIFATRDAALTFQNRGKAEAYAKEWTGGPLTPVRVADLPDPSGPNVLRKNPMKRTAKKKPAFGKKSVAKKRAAPTRDYRVKRSAFSRREAILAMKKNPSLGSRISHFVVRAVKHDGDIMYFDGCHFKGDRKKAATFSGKAGQAVMEKIERDHAATLKRGGVKYLDVVQA